MMPGALLSFSASQVVSGAGMTPSTNVIDREAPTNLGSGKPIHCYVSFRGVAPTGTAPTLTAALVGADDAAFSVNKITIGQVSPALVSGQVPTGNPEVPIPSHVPKRFFRLEYTLGGTSPAMTVSADFVEDFQTMPAPPLS